jgi:hypothetical protein
VLSETDMLEKMEEHRMAVKKVGEKFSCNICHNKVTVTKVGGGTLVCHDIVMVKVEGKFDPTK